MTQRAAEPVYITPTRWEQLRFVLAWGAFYAWYASHFAWLPGVIARVDVEDPCQRLGTLQLLLVYVLVASSVPALIFGAKAWRTRHATQYPPPGSWVLFRTRVHTARWWVTANKVALAAMAFACAVLPVLVWRELGGLTIFFEHGC